MVMPIDSSSSGRHVVRLYSCDGADVAIRGPVRHAATGEDVMEVRALSERSRVDLALSSAVLWLRYAEMEA